MTNAYDHESTVYFGFGEADPYGTADWTDEDWAEYDAQCQADMLLWDEQNDDGYVDLDPEPPF